MAALALQPQPLAPPRVHFASLPLQLLDTGDSQARGPQVEGFVVREFCPYPSNFASQESLQDYLIRHGIVAITDVDTRALTKRIRTAGAMRLAARRPQVS